MKKTHKMPDGTIMAGAKHGTKKVAKKQGAKKVAKKMSSGY